MGAATPSQIGSSRKAVKTGGDAWKRRWYMSPLQGSMPQDTAPGSDVPGSQQTPPGKGTQLPPSPPLGLEASAPATSSKGAKCRPGSPPLLTFTWAGITGLGDLRVSISFAFLVVFVVCFNIYTSIKKFIIKKQQTKMLCGLISPDCKISLHICPGSSSASSCVKWMTSVGSMQGGCKHAMGLYGMDVKVGCPVERGSLGS